jgi:hypothetical protein
VYCGHCGAAVEEHDQFCRSCGARFVDVGAPTAGPGTLPPPATSIGAVGAMPPPAMSIGAADALAGGDPTMAMPVGPADDGDDADPTSLIAVTSGPGGPGARPFLIGAAFALIVVAGIVAFFLLRGNGSTARPIPSGPTNPTVSTVAPTTAVLPSVETTSVPTNPTTTAAPTTLVETTPPPTEAPTTPPTTGPSGGTVPINTATIPGAVPTTASAAVPSVVATTARPRPVTTTTRPRATTTTAAAPTTPAATAPPPTAPPPTAPPPAGAPSISAARASSTRAGGIDSCGQPTTYSASNVLDGQLATAWMTQGDGVGQFLEFDIAGGQVTQVGLVPGYAKQDPCSGSDRFHDMRRIVQVRWTFDGGGSVTQNLDPDSATMQTMQLAAPVSAGTVRLTILGTTDPGTAGFDFSPISEVSLT